MKLTIEIELGNDAMTTGYEAGYAINRALVQQVGLSDLSEGDDGAIVDANGNTVGKWKVV